MLNYNLLFRINIKSRCEYYYRKTPCPVPPKQQFCKIREGGLDKG